MKKRRRNRRRKRGDIKERAFFEFRPRPGRISLVLTLSPHYVEQWAILQTSIHRIAIEFYFESYCMLKQSYRTVTRAAGESLDGVVSALMHSICNATVLGSGTITEIAINPTACGNNNANLVISADNHRNKRKKRHPALACENPIRARGRRYCM
jgi:hypothetical protein